MPTNLKRAALWAIGGAALGTAVAALAAPSLISWWYAPPVGAGLDCGPAVDWALGQLIRALWITAAGVGVLGAVLSFVLGRKPAEAPASPTA